MIAEPESLADDHHRDGQSPSGPSTLNSQPATAPEALTRREVMDLLRALLDEFERRLQEGHYLESQR